MVNYLKDVYTNYTIERNPVQLDEYGNLPGTDSTGYGSKIITNWIVRFDNAKRFSRIFAACYSNVASFYILKGKQKLYIKDSEFP